MKLPTYETDCYELDDGEALNREYPDSFWIPDNAVRESLAPDDFVKLIFRMEKTVGADALSVLDPQLRVRGVQGLRVVDTSIMPTIVSGNTNAPAMAIGSKAAELIASDRRAG